jgi:hypothetical protein
MDILKHGSGLEALEPTTLKAKIKSEQKNTEKYAQSIS